MWKAKTVKLPRESTNKTKSNTNQTKQVSIPFVLWQAQKTMPGCQRSQVLQVLLQPHKSIEIRTKEIQWAQPTVQRETHNVLNQTLRKNITFGLMSLQSIFYSPRGNLQLHGVGEQRSISQHNMVVVKLGGNIIQKQKGIE